MAKFLIAKSKHIRTKGWHLDNLMKLDSQNVENAGVWGDDPGNDPGPLFKLKKKIQMKKSCILSNKKDGGKKGGKSTFTKFRLNVQRRIQRLAF